MFDLVITSDIFEHIRDPYSAFKEVNRVLKPGASHVFTIPILRPFQQKTVRRVCTDTDEDIHLLPPHYHIAGDGGKSLVYNDFGIDLIAKLESQMTVKLKVFDFQAESSTAPKEVGRVLCFIATKL